jgi:hypothetical protein
VKNCLLRRIDEAEQQQQNDPNHQGHEGGCDHDTYERGKDERNNLLEAFIDGQARPGFACLFQNLPDTAVIPFVARAFFAHVTLPVTGPSVECRPCGRAA